MAKGQQSLNKSVESNVSSVTNNSITNTNGAIGNATTSTNKGLKCVAVGDPTVGKSSMFIAFTSSGFVKDYVPTTFDNFNKNMVGEDGTPVALHLWDTAGQDELSHLRQLSYSQADVFFVVFSVCLPSSYENIYTKWLPEVRRFSSDTPIILIGTKIDLREDSSVIENLASMKQKPITYEKGQEMMKNIGALGYYECSALTHKGLSDVFLQTIKTLNERQPSNSKKGKNGKKKSKCSIM